MRTLAVDPALQLIVRASLSLLFARAALHKLRDVAGFGAALERYELLPAPWAVPAGAFVIAAEVGVAAGVWLPRVAPAAALGAAALLALYAGAIAVNLVRGRRDIDCGCSGPARRQPISAALVVRNGVIAAAAVLGALPAGPRALLWVDGVTVAASVAALACLYAAADGLLAESAHGRGTPGDEQAMVTEITDGAPLRPFASFASFAVRWIRHDEAPHA
jgi:hypothetical protein